MKMGGHGSVLPGGGAEIRTPARSTREGRSDEDEYTGRGLRAVATLGTAVCSVRGWTARLS